MAADTQSQNTSVTHIIDSIIESAFEEDASDVHIDPTQDKVIIKFRIDGLLIAYGDFNKNIHAGLISRIKILAKLRTDEHHTPQDGRFRKHINDDFIDVRVSIMPTYYGENAVLRLLRNTLKSLELSQLAFSHMDYEKVYKALQESHGMIVATGPTGAGKTTTLYTLLKHLNTGNKSIITLEDPIEYAIDGIRQIQINAQRGFTFAQGLRSVIRQDPNIIMVGEIRDQETAHISIQTALTGHKLLSTLHTSDAATAIPRFLDMGIEPYLLASTLKVIIAQRLIRKLCIHCRQIKTCTDSEKEIFRKYEIDTKNLDAKNINLHTSSGCKKCYETGFSGRIGIYEVLMVNDKIRFAIMSNSSTQDIQAIASESGMRSFLQDGLTKVLLGITSIDEVFSTLHE